MALAWVGGSVERGVVGCGRVGLDCGRVGLACGRVSLSCGRVDLGCGRVSLDCGRVGLSCGRVGLGCRRVSLSCGRVGRGRIGVVVGIDGLVLIKVGVNGDVFRSLVRVGGRGVVAVSTAVGMARLVAHGGRSLRLVYILLGSLGKAKRYY